MSQFFKDLFWEGKQIQKDQKENETVSSVPIDKKWNSFISSAGPFSKRFYSFSHYKKIKLDIDYGFCGLFFISQKSMVF